MKISRRLTLILLQNVFATCEQLATFNSLVNTDAIPFSSQMETESASNIIQNLLSTNEKLAKFNDFGNNLINIIGDRNKNTCFSLYDIHTILKSCVEGLPNMFYGDPIKNNIFLYGNEIPKNISNLGFIRATSLYFNEKSKSLGFIRQLEKYFTDPSTHNRNQTLPKPFEYFFYDESKNSYEEIGKEMAEVINNITEIKPDINITDDTTWLIVNAFKLESKFKYSFEDQKIQGTYNDIEDVEYFSGKRNLLFKRGKDYTLCGIPLENGLYYFIDMPDSYNEHSIFHMSEFSEINEKKVYIEYPYLDLEIDSGKKEIDVLKGYNDDLFVQSKSKIQVTHEGVKIDTLTAVESKFRSLSNQPKRMIVNKTHYFSIGSIENNKVYHYYVGRINNVKK